MRSRLPLSCLVVCNECFNGRTKRPCSERRRGWVWMILLTAQHDDRTPACEQRFCEAGSIPNERARDNCLDRLRNSPQAVRITTQLLITCCNRSVQNAFRDAHRIHASLVHSSRLYETSPNNRRPRIHHRLYSNLGMVPGIRHHNLFGKSFAQSVPIHLQFNADPGYLE